VNIYIDNINKNTRAAITLRSLRNGKRLAGTNQINPGVPIAVERVRIVDSGIKIEGDFELPALARLPAEDQVFVMAFYGVTALSKKWNGCLVSAIPR